MKLLSILAFLMLTACTTVQVQESKFTTCRTVKAFAKGDLIRVVETSYSACRTISEDEYRRVMQVGQ